MDNGVMKPINAICIGLFGVIAGHFVAIALLFVLSYALGFLFNVSIESVLGEPVGMIVFIIVVSLLCGPLTVYLCISIPSMLRWWLRHAKDRHRRCLNCGYDLYRCRATRCPECGKAMPIEQRQRLAHIESSHA